ncbi:MAG: putative lipid II flippase FtsW [Clostridia bacterium]|nr:putative lipid II flippase FtsW [Clostridia bacterium]
MLFKNRSGYHILLFSLLLSLIGLVFVYSAGSYSAELRYGDAFFFVKKQAAALGVGLVAFFSGRFIKPEWLKKCKWIVLALSAVFLALVYVPGLGMSSYGATRWISFGFVTFQPSEISKFGLMIFLAGCLADHPPTRIKNCIVPTIAVIVCCSLVITEPNMSITMVMALSALLLFYAAGLPKKSFILLLIVAVLGAAGLILAEPYRLKRLTAFLDPWQNPKAEGYQLIQSFYAVASGGLFGKGLFKSRQKLLFLPFAESDFIFSVIAEETGLFGCTVLMSIFAAFIISGFRTALAAKNRYEMLLSTGLTAVIGFQTLINLAVVTGCIPPTGVPLPFVSAGGSSLISFLLVSGILSGLSARTKNTVSA